MYERMHNVNQSDVWYRIIELLMAWYYPEDDFRSTSMHFKFIIQAIKTISFGSFVCILKFILVIKKFHVIIIFFLSISH